MRYIKLSYRIRGRVARIHTNNVAIIIVFIISVRFDRMGIYPMKKIDDRSLIIRMLVYSAIKIRANRPPLYSILNPDTSSDSPSAKSKGERFVSAKFVMNQKINIIEIMINGQESKFVDIDAISIFLWMSKALIRIRDMETSYEIVCATPRKAPSSAYFELEDQPARKVQYTFILDTHKKYRIPNVKKIAGLECG